jgi:hypothetical protein
MTLNGHERLHFTRHALMRMRRKEITRDAVYAVVGAGRSATKGKVEIFFLTAAETRKRPYLRPYLRVVVVMDHDRVVTTWVRDDSDPTPRSRKRRPKRRRAGPTTS